ncbi:MAG: 6-carboxytetrahydropterin synthase, partial [Gemmatimonadetes bacterium]|nr:6-carboxytetrahydropterin synthase [Gemmatimonadota bacterium]NIQ56934.1 6-carboxytetrahydropterin synthase [Gemmatimonadota bacterium]NIU77108.1 6-carboxytetrahydropterin synthase [Gammaproteobacteria bacterium]NIX46426.1 6-carboxytetrahydropterin synthase [Gemmatimonadota bacterium]NIY10741.1 6-carboxytetrahydropterin synthase [Gemmatimonadota bacterium]
MAYLTRRATFAAAHRYWRDDWSEERNRAVFGACANPHGHGHNYALEATVEGEIDDETGFSVDLGALDDAL